MDIVVSGLESVIEEAIVDLLPILKKYPQVSLRTACYILSLNKLHAHYQNVGIALSTAVKIGKKE